MVGVVQKKVAVKTLHQMINEPRSKEEEDLYIAKNQALMERLKLQKKDM
jgi:hypothetical protein